MGLCVPLCLSFPEATTTKWGGTKMFFARTSLSLCAIHRGKAVYFFPAGIFPPGPVGNIKSKQRGGRGLFRALSAKSGKSGGGGRGGNKEMEPGGGGWREGRREGGERGRFPAGASRIVYCTEKRGRREQQMIRAERKGGKEV